MKKMITYLVLFLSIFSLVGCSTNTRSENTGIGAGTGAIVGGLAGSLFGQGTGKVVAVGLGAIAGALIGGTIGHNMDSSDCQQTYTTLNHNTPNKSKHWTNKKTGTQYTVTPTSNMMTYQGNPNCRTYNTTSITSDGKTQTVNGTACRQSNGTWQEVKSS